MIYVDQPVGTGFSYSVPDGEFLNTMDECATEWVTFMKSLYAKYPELVNKPLYMAGESYAGKYLPVFSWSMLEDNTSSLSPFNLQATLIGDGYPAPYSQRLSMYKVPKAINIIDEINMPQIAALERLCGDLLPSYDAAAESMCASPISYVTYDVGGGAYGYD
jgi:carboxypeptidase C (cathepsin A)